MKVSLCMLPRWLIFNPIQYSSWSPEHSMSHMIGKFCMRGVRGPPWRGPTASHDIWQPYCGVDCDEGARVGSLKK